MDANDLLLVFSNPVAGQEDAYNAWYDDVHLGDVLAVPGVVGAQRFELTPSAAPDAASSEALPPPHQYLAVYRLDGDPVAVAAELGARVAAGTMVIDPSFDFTTLSMFAWRPRAAERLAGA